MTQPIKDIMQARGSPSFLHTPVHSPKVSKPEVPHAVQSAFFGFGDEGFGDSQEGIKALREQIATGSPEERELAVDILTNLAAGSGHTTADAGNALHEVYARPGNSDPAVNQQIRQRIEGVSLGLCLAHFASPPQTTPDSRDHGKHGLSIAVAYLASRAEDPPYGGIGGTMRDQIEHFLAQELPNDGKKEQYLGKSRPIRADELLPACAKLTSLKIGPAPLLVADKSPAKEKQFLEPLQDAIKALNKQPSGSCTSFTLHTNDPAYGHWMTLVLQKEDDGVIQCHVADSNATASAGRNVHTKLVTLLEGVLPGSKIHFHQVDLQGVSDPQEGEEPAAGSEGCGVFVMLLLKAIDEKVAAKEHFDVGEVIDQRLADFADASPADQHALVVSGRIGLLSALADGSKGANGGGVVIIHADEGAAADDGVDSSTPVWRFNVHWDPQENDDGPVEQRLK